MSCPSLPHGALPCRLPNNCFYELTEFGIVPFASHVLAWHVGSLLCSPKCDLAWPSAPVQLLPCSPKFGMKSHPLSRVLPLGAGSCATASMLRACPMPCRTCSLAIVFLCSLKCGWESCRWKRCWCWHAWRRRLDLMFRSIALEGRACQGCNHSWTSFASSSSAPRCEFGPVDEGWLLVVSLVECYCHQRGVIGHGLHLQTEAVGNIFGH